MFCSIEPTSGLDSTSAVALIRLLQSLAIEQRKTVITTIHQPSSALFRSFDRLLLLSEGSVVYFGNPVDSLNYLEKLGFPCPTGYNGAGTVLLLYTHDVLTKHVSFCIFSDYWMDLLVLQDEDEEATKKRLQLEQAWEYSNPAGEQLCTEEEVWAQSGRTGKYESSWWVQYSTLTHRALKNSRSAIFTPLNLVKSIALGIVAGLLWFQREYTESNLNDIQSYYFFTMVCTYQLVTALLVLTIWPLLRHFGCLMPCLLH